MNATPTASFEHTSLVLDRLPFSVMEVFLVRLPGAKHWRFVVQKTRYLLLRLGARSFLPGLCRARWMQCISSLSNTSLLLAHESAAQVCCPGMEGLSTFQIQ